MTLTYEQHQIELAQEIAKRHQATSRLAQQLGAMTSERDRQIQRAAKAEMELAKLREALDARALLVDSIGQGGIRQLFAIVLGFDQADELGQILAQFKPHKPPGHYGELGQLIQGMTERGDEYEAAEYVRDWLRGWGA